jgi:hypothetical protein
MQIIVQTLSFGAICLGVKASDTIDDIKKALRRHIDTLYTGYDVELIYGAESVARWTFNGVTLDGYRSASWYDIAEGGTIRSTFSLPGGAGKRGRSSKDDDDDEVKNFSGIADMTHVTMTAEARDCAIVGEAMQKRFDSSNDLIDALNIESLEILLEIVLANPKHLLTDTSIRKYANLLPEMLEIQVANE